MCPNTYICIYLYTYISLDREMYIYRNKYRYRYIPKKEDKLHLNRNTPRADPNVGIS